MNQMNIYFASDTDLSEYEAISKGYRHDVFVRINEIYYHINIYTIERLTQDFKVEMECDGYFAIEPNIVLVKESSKKEIIFTLNHLYLGNYFDNLATCNDIPELVKIQ